MWGRILNDRNPRCHHIISICRSIDLVCKHKREYGKRPPSYQLIEIYLTTIFPFLSTRSDLFVFLSLSRLYSSIPSQYVDNNSIQHDGSGDVVIVVPAIDTDKTESILVSRLPHEHSVCIDAEEAELLEPNSPKTITESSSKYSPSFLCLNYN